MPVYKRSANRAASGQSEAADTLRQPLSFISREMIAGVFDSQTRARRDLTVCFTGHRHIPAQDASALRNRLDRVLEKLYQMGYRDFISGAALGFDMLAAEQVCCLRSRHPDVQLILAIPCSTQSARWADADVQRYERMVYAADETRVLSTHYFQGCMQMRNRYMVDRSALCLAYLTHMKGGTMATVAYAMQAECPVLNVAMEDACDAFVRAD